MMQRFKMHSKAERKHLICLTSDIKTTNYKNYKKKMLCVCVCLSFPVTWIWYI